MKYFPAKPGWVASMKYSAFLTFACVYHCSVQTSIYEYLNNLSPIHDYTSLLYTTKVSKKLNSNSKVMSCKISFGVWLQIAYSLKKVFSRETGVVTPLRGCEAVSGILHGGRPPMTWERVGSDKQFMWVYWWWRVTWVSFCFMTS